MDFFSNPKSLFFFREDLEDAFTIIIDDNDDDGLTTK